MARKNNLKSENAGSIQFDPQTKAVLASETQDHSIKEKVSAVREVIPGKSNNEIVLVLQYYDYDVEKAIQAYFEDGAKAALTEWHFSGNKVSNKKKKNKKAKAANSSQTAPNGAASQPANQRLHIDSNSNVTKEPLLNGDILNNTSGDDIPTNKDQEDRLSVSASVSSNLLASSSRSSQQRPEGPSPPETHSKPQPQRTNHRHDKHSGPHGHLHNEHGRQRTSSERSTSSIGVKDNKAKKPFAGLERSTKDLHRQTTSLERLRLVLATEFEKSYKRIHTVFEEAHNVLKKQEVEIVKQLDTVKANANLVFSQRQEKAQELKTRIERAERFSESELAELRADIKLFVSDRKVDEDLGRTTRFLYDSDRLFEVMRNFAEVVPVNCAYSTRRPSQSSVGSSALSPEDVPASPGFHKITNSLDTPSSPLTVPTNDTSRDALSTEEMAELQYRLKNSLKLQGVPVKSPPPRNRPISAPVKTNNEKDDSRQNKNNARKDQPRKTEQNEAKEKTRESNSIENVRQDGGSSNRPSSGSRSPRRNYGRGQSSPQRFNDGRPRSEGGQRGRGDSYRGGRGDGGRWREDGRGRGRDRRGGRGRGDYRGGRGMSRGAAPVQSSQSTTTSSSATTAAVPSASSASTN